MAGQQYSNEDYTVGWICALPETELVAAVAMLDEQHPLLPAADPQDVNTYLFGRIGDHNVVIACLPAETTGKVAAATVATNMIRSFSSIRFGLMVGIGGGVPCVGHHGEDTSDGPRSDSDDESEEEMEEMPDIRLGDVVVSLHSKSTEAVVQYDFGKSLQAKEFVHTGGKLNKPPHIVLSAVAQLQANHALGRHKIPALLSNMPTAIAKFQHPGVDRDRLFRADVVHVEGIKSCKTCYGFDNANIVKRKERSDTVPKIHYGTIGSADQVMKDALLRDQWASKENILCFEMEAAGLMDSFPCLVIRGICDYADSHKNKKWQPYAAATAAAYAKELLLVIPGQGLTKLSPIKQLLHISEQIHDLNSSLVKAFEQRENHHHDQVVRYLTEDQRRCHQSFKTSTYEKFKDINPIRVEGTCGWALKSPEYMRWWNATSDDLLWISADPGCGKSVLAKSLVEDVFRQPDSNVTILYFFFKDHDEQNNIATALCAVLHQLFSLQPQLLRHALPYLAKSKEKIQHEVDDMWRIFMAATSDPVSRNTICVFDALDECRDEDQRQLIEKLREFHDRRRTSQINWLKFLATSRPYDDIQDRFRPLTRCFPQIHLCGEGNDELIREEINLVVKIKMAELRERLGLEAWLHERLEKELLDMKHRTYLWLYLAIDNIESTFKNSLWPDQESIPLIPKTVNEAYHKILERVDPKHEAVVRNVLRIIVGARRPLTIQEMAMALGVASRSTRTAEKAAIRVTGLSDKLRRLCGLFVFVKDSKIYLIHQTAREFLMRRADDSTCTKWSSKPNEVEFLMAQICVRYLLMDDLLHPGQDTVRSLLKYSAQNWPDHFRNISPHEDKLTEAVLQLYDTSTTLFRVWFKIFWDATMSGMAMTGMQALSIASFNGHDNIIRLLIPKVANDVDRRNTHDMTALQWASLQGHCRTVDLLLEQGADVNAYPGMYGSALCVASKNGHLEIVQQLLKHGADINAKHKIQGNALHAASERGHLEIVRQLLDHGANVNAKGGFHGNALQSASRCGHLEIVQLLLEHGAVAQSDEYSHALQVASENASRRLVLQNKKRKR